MELSKVLEKELLEGRFWTHSKTLVDGCTKVSPGCLNCWSESLAKRFGNHVGVFDGGWNGNVIEHPKRLLEILPKSGHRKPRVWTYWNDIFHGKVTDALRDRLFKVIHHSQDFHIICTKRPIEVRRYWNNPNTPLNASMYFPNVIFMVSIEDQERINERMPYAMKLAAMGYNVGLLCEPMLEHLNLCLDIWPVLPKWIICGPENGKGKRPFDTDWAIGLQAQAAYKGIPFFYKAGLLNGKRYIETP
jgi:protein gp37